MEVLELFKELQSGKNKTVTPVKLEQTLRKMSNTFGNHKQQDAHELLMFLVLTKNIRSSCASCCLTDKKIRSRWKYGA